MPMTCQDAFNRAKILRTNHPLKSGVYKMKETLLLLERIRATVAGIALREQNRMNYRPGESLGCCTADDRAKFLKDIPQYVAELLGYTILPTIAALGGDGVPKAEVQRMLIRAETDAQRLINDCEVLRLRLKGGIKHEYDAMRWGDSALLRLLDAVLAQFEPR